MSATPRKQTRNNSLNQSSASVQVKDRNSVKIQFIENSIAHISEEVQNMKVLDTLVGKFDDIINLENQLVEEINKFRELEKKISSQNLELEVLERPYVTISTPLLVSSSEAKISEIKGEKNEENLERAEFERNFKIKCKSDIIQVLKDGLSGIFEIRMEVNKEINEMRKEIVEVLPIDFSISYSEELECIEDKAEWIKVDIERICENAIQQFELYVDVIGK